MQIVWPDFSIVFDGVDVADIGLERKHFDLSRHGTHLHK